MPTVKLIPSAWSGSSSYVTVSNANNMYANTSSTNYATVSNTNKNTTVYYCQIKGFNFNAVPSDAVVTSFTIRIKAYGNRMGSNKTPSLFHGNSVISSSVSALSTSAQTLTFTNVNVSWDTLKSYGSDFYIRIPVQRSNKNQAVNIYVYGAEIEVEYSIPSSSKFFIKEMVSG